MLRDIKDRIRRSSAYLVVYKEWNHKSGERGYTEDHN